MLFGETVQLRPVEPSDYADILRWQNDPEVFYWMDYVDPFDLDDIRRSEERAAEEGTPFVIVCDGVAIGRIGLNNFRPRDRMASLYVFVGERVARGSGCGFDAVMTVLAYGFEQLNLRRIELWTLEGNERALRLYKAAGFVEDARLPGRSFKDGEYFDHIVMSVDREAFSRARDARGA